MSNKALSHRHLAALEELLFYDPQGLGFPPVSSSSEFLVSTLTGLNGKVSGATLIDTPLSSSLWAPIFCQIEATTVSGFVSVPSLSIGSNATSYNNFLATTTMTGLNASNLVLKFTTISPCPYLSSGTGFFVNITTPASATTYTLRVSVVAICPA